MLHWLYIIRASRIGVTSTKIFYFTLRDSLNFGKQVPMASDRLNPRYVNSYSYLLVLFSGEPYSGQLERSTLVC